MDRMIEAIASSGLDCVTFTSAPAVASMLMLANPPAEPLLRSLRGRVLAACVGPITAAPLEELDVPTSSRTAPPLARWHAMSLRNSRAAATGSTPAGTNSSVRGGRRRRRPDQAVAARRNGFERTLAHHRVAVVSRQLLLAALPGGGDDPHAVETAIARLRSALGAPKIVQTVVSGATGSRWIRWRPSPEIDPAHAGVQ